MKIVIASILAIACKVSEVNSQLSLHGHFSQTAYLLQTQPMLSFHISKPVFIVCPTSVEVLCTITSSLKHGPSTSVLHVTPDREGLPTPWVYGVHSRPSAAQHVGLLTVKGQGVQVGIAYCIHIWEEEIFNCTGTLESGVGNVLSFAQCSMYCYFACFVYIRT